MFRFCGFARLLLFTVVLSQLPSFYFRRFGQYLCEVTVTEEDQAPAGDRYRAHLDQVERETADGHIPVTMDVPDVFGPSRYKRFVRSNG